MATKKNSPLVSLHQLQLDNVRALVGHELLKRLPSPDTEPAGYLQGLLDALSELSLKDPLTGLANRRHFCSIQERTIDIVARSGESALLLMLDIDHFKKVNDTYGHQAGDQVLKAVAKTLSKCVRPMDTIARYGGEEFAIVLPDCPPEFGDIVAERIRRAVERLKISISLGVTIQVTLSVGGAYAPEWIRSTATLWTERADAQLYRAKSEGRNRVSIEKPHNVFVSAEEKSMLFGPLSQSEPAWIENMSSDGPEPTESPDRGG